MRGAYLHVAAQNAHARRSVQEMSSIKDPKRKKELAYERDHPVHPGVEYPKASRKGIPRKKAETQRRLRRKTKQMIENDTEGVESLVKPEAKRLRSQIKVFSRGAPLGEVIDARKKNRSSREGGKKRRRRTEQKTELDNS